MRATRFLIGLLVSGGLLLIWREAHQASCLALAAPAVAAAFLAIGLRRGATFRRRVVAAALFRERSVLRRLVASPALPTAYAVVLALLLVGALFLDVATMTPAALGVLILGGGLATAAVGAALAGALGPTLQPVAARIVVRGWTAAITFLLVTAALIVVKLWSPTPEYAGLPLRDAVAAAIGEAQSACPWIQEALKLEAARDAFAWRVALGADDAAKSFGAAAHWAAWLVFFLLDGLTAYAYCRLTAELISPDFSGYARG